MKPPYEKALKKIRITDIEIVPEDSEENEIAKLERKIAFLQKDVRQDKQCVIEMKDSKLVELQEKINSINSLIEQNYTKIVEKDKIIA